MYINRRVSLFIVIFLVFINSFVIADKGLNELEKKLDNQNNILYEEILENKVNEPNTLEELLRESDRKNKNNPQQFDLGKLASGIQKGSILLAIKARKYIVPFTILILLFNIFMLSATGAKNINNRKKYIMGSALFYILFLIILNFPLYLLWRTSQHTSDVLNFNAFYKFVEGVSIFLKKNSFVFSVIIFSFGVINKISSQTNLPKILASDFMIKMSFILFALFNLMPYILKLAV